MVDQARRRSLEDEIQKRYAFKETIVYSGVTMVEVGVNVDFRRGVPGLGPDDIKVYRADSSAYESARLQKAVRQARPVQSTKPDRKPRRKRS